MVSDDQMRNATTTKRSRGKGSTRSYNFLRDDREEFRTLNLVESERMCEDDSDSATQGLVQILEGTYSKKPGRERASSHKRWSPPRRRRRQRRRRRITNLRRKNIARRAATSAATVITITTKLWDYGDSLAAPRLERPQRPYFLRVSF